MIHINSRRVAALYTFLLVVLIGCNIINSYFNLLKSSPSYSTKTITVEPTSHLHSNEGNHYDDVGIVARHFNHRYHAISAPESR